MKLTDGLVSALEFQTLDDEYELAWVHGMVADEDGMLVLDVPRQQVCDFQLGF